jgi:hypothetical protein
MDLKQRLQHHLDRLKKAPDIELRIAQVEKIEAMLDRLDREEEEEMYPVGYESCVEICSQLSKVLGSELRADEENGSITVYFANNPNLFAYCKDFSETNDLLRDISQSEMVSFLVSPASLIYYLRNIRAQNGGRNEG